MNHNTKRILSVVLLLSLIVVVFSANGESSSWDCPGCGRKGNTGNYCGGCAHPAPGIGGETPMPESEANDIFRNYTNGDIIIFGEYEQDHDYSNGKEGIEWIVLEVEENSILLISKYAIDAKEYNRDYNDSNVTWETCSLRKWLNNDFYNSAFNENERSMIIESDLQMDDNPEYKTKGGNSTKDKVFLLSLTEADKYFTDNDLRICYGTPHTNKLSDDPYTPNGSRLWWLRTPGYFGQLASIIYYDGKFETYGDYVYKDLCTVRPAIRIKIE